MNYYNRIAIASLALFFSAHAAAISMPIEMLCPDAQSSATTLTLHTAGAPGKLATQLFLEIHNLRYQGQLSVRLNAKSWVDLSNTNPKVSFDGNDGELGGIGGIQGTVRIKVAIDPTWTKEGPQTLELRFNGTDGNVTALRILDIQLLKSDGVNVVTDIFTFDDPSKWVAPAIYDTPAKVTAAVAAGKALWTKANALVDNPISKQSIKASCSSCHFEDGGDLRYFSYSNATIQARAQFHGLSAEEGNQLAAYIRDASVDTSRATKYPALGRPWNPPFQPWADAETVSPQNWMAGGGLESVVNDETEAIRDILKYGINRVGVERIIDHEGRNTGAKNPPVFSIKTVRIPMQFPDWNMWLPLHAPEDMWASTSDVNLITGPFRTSYNAFNANAARPVASFEADLFQTLDFIGTIRNTNFELGTGAAFRLDDQDLRNDQGLGKRRKANYSRDEMTDAVSKYGAVKTLNIVREFGLEDRAKTVLAGNSIRDGERSIPSYGSTVFDIAPHIGANNWLYRQGSTLKVGKLISNQWYHLQIVLNAGMRGINPMNNPLDWDYQLAHLQDFYNYSRINVGARILGTTIKMYESRDNGNGVKKEGFSLRTLHPYNLYTPKSYNRNYFDLIDKTLWAKITEEFLYEWLDVMTKYDLSNSQQVSRTTLAILDYHSLPPSTARPTNWTGEGNPLAGDGATQNHLDNTWRLIPILLQEGIDEGLLRDFAQWASIAWPGPTAQPTSWGSLFNATPPTPGYGNRARPKVIFLENFENVTGTNYPFTALTGVSTIKNSNYVKTDRTQSIPKNGGGFKVGRKTLTNGTSSLAGTVPAGGITLTTGTTKIRVRTRVATPSITAGTVQYNMVIGYNSGGSQTSPSMTLSRVLSGWKFQTYEETLTIPVGATKITSITLQPTGDASTTGAAFYFDNVAVIEESAIVDTQAPAAPDIRLADGSNIDTLSNRNGSKNGTTVYEAGIIVRWNKNTETDILGYNIYRSTDAGATWSSEAINNGPIYAEPGTTDNPVTIANHIDSNVDSNTTYTYAVTAIDRSGNESPKSESASYNLAATATGKNDPPFSNPNPVWVAPTTAGDIRWFASAELDCIGYNVYASKDGIQPYTKLNTTLVTTPNFLDSNPAVGKKYYVQAVDGSNQVLAAGGTLQNVSVATQSNSGFPPYTFWAQSYGLPSDGTGLGAMTASPAGDGITNLVKASLGISPLVAGYQSRLGTATVLEAGIAHLTLTYSRPSTGMDEYSYTIEVSSDLTTWVSDSSNVGEISRTTSNGVTTVTTKDLKTGAKRFIRLRISI